MSRLTLAALGAAALLAAGGGSALSAQDRPGAGREAAEALVFEPLDWHPPRPEEHVLSNGVVVLYLHDDALPLVNVLARFRGGYTRFSRAYYAAGMALPSLVRNGGTTTLSPDSLDRLQERWAVQTVFGGGGSSAYSTVNTLTSHLEPALALWADILKNPGFDSARVEVWRGQELERVLRQDDDPGSLAVSAFNHLMYGDHPIGWEMRPSDLEPEDLSEARLRWIHERVFCPGNLILGVTGDVAWEEIFPLLEGMMEGWRPCPEPLPAAPLPDIHRGGGVYLIPRDIEQSVLVLAHASDLQQGDEAAYFASRIGNSLLGASGFSSRMMERLRTDEGYAYGVSSIWTAPRKGQGLVGAFTRTKGASTVAAAELLLEIMEGVREAPPERDEVETAVDQIVNGFVFAFDSPAQIVSRQMLYRAEDYPADWLERYVAGIQAVDAADVQRVFREHLRPDDMTILVVGDREGFDRPLETLGPVTVLPAVDAGR